MKKNWLTRDGRILKIKEMETNHIVNALAMLKRNGFVSKDTFENFFGGIRSLCDKPVNEYIDLFENELGKRGVKV